MLQNSQTLSDLLFSGEKLSSGIMVATKLIPKLEVYGFLPYCVKNSGLDMNMKDTCVVANHLIIHLNDKIRSTLNIYPFIEYASENQMIPLRFLYRPEGWPCLTGVFNDYYKCQKEKYDKNGILWTPKRYEKGIVRGENEMLWSVNKGEYLLFNDKDGGVKAVGRSFLVICRRINDMTGILAYELYNAEDLFPIE